MKKTLRMTAIILTALILSVVSASAENKVAPDLTIAGVGARPLAMGKAFVAVADDANALFLNPAGLAFKKGWEVTSLSTRLMENVDYKMAGGFLPTPIGPIGVGYLMVTSGAGTNTTVSGSGLIEPGAPINYYSNTLYLAYARKINEHIKMSESLGELSAGVNLKIKSQGLTGGAAGSAGGYDADAALLWKLNDRLTLGANAQNLVSTSKWTTGQQEKTKQNLKIGAAYHLNKQLLIAADSDLGDNSLLHIGAEYQPTDYLALRAGIDQNPLANGNGTVSTVSNLGAGVGLSFQGIKFDYAYYADAEFTGNSTHYFSLSLSDFAPQKQVVAKKDDQLVKAAKNSDSIYQSSSRVDGVYRLDRQLQADLTKKAPESPKTDASLARLNSIER